jgi:hypothetical protein
MVSLLLFRDGSDKHVLYGSQSPILSGRNSPIAQKLDAEAGEYQVKNDAKKEKKEVFTNVPRRGRLLLLLARETSSP